MLPVLLITGFTGENTNGTLNPGVPLELTMLAASCLERSLLACITIMSTTTSALGLSRSWTIFSANCTASTVADHQRLLRVVGEHAPDIGHRADRRRDLLKFLGRGRVGHIRNFQHFVVVIAMLGGIVFRNENRAGGDRFPERVRQHGEVVESLLRRSGGISSRLKLWLGCIANRTARSRPPLSPRFHTESSPADC